MKTPSIRTRKAEPIYRRCLTLSKNSWDKRQMRQPSVQWLKNTQKKKIKMKTPRIQRGMGRCQAHREQPVMEDQLVLTLGRKASSVTTSFTNSEKSQMPRPRHLRTRYPNLRRMEVKLKHCFLSTFPKSTIYRLISRNPGKTYTNYKWLKPITSMLLQMQSKI